MAEQETKQLRRAVQASGLAAGVFTSLGVHRGDGFNEQWGIGLSVLHKHQQELQCRFNHQTELRGGKRS